MLALARAVSAESAEEVILHLLYQLVVILAVTRAVVFVARRFGQTDVSGEILAGLLLGPSLLGEVWPEALDFLFPTTAESTAIFTALSQLGLVLLMFQIGSEFDFSTALAGRERSVAALSAIGVVVPYALGFATAQLFWDRLPETTRPELLDFRLFFAVAMSITAIPVLGRIFMELGISRTRVAALTIGAAAIDDVLGWLLLGSATLVARGDLSITWVLTRFAGITIYVAAAFFVVRPLLSRYIASERRKHGGISTPALATLLLVMFGSAAITSRLSVFALIGGFVIGLTLHADREFVEEWRHRVAPLVTTLLLPLFFTYTGLRTDIGTLGDRRELWICLAVIGVAFAGKFGGVYVGAKRMGETTRDALTIATCMNTRGLMELIALNVGLDLGVLPPSMFTKLVLMSLLSTFLATPVIRYLTRQTGEVATAP